MSEPSKLKHDPEADLRILAVHRCLPNQLRGAVVPPASLGPTSPISNPSSEGAKYIGDNTMEPLQQAAPAGGRWGNAEPVAHGDAAGRRTRAGAARRVVVGGVGGASWR